MHIFVNSLKSSEKAVFKQNQNKTNIKEKSLGLPQEKELVFINEKELGQKKGYISKLQNQLISKFTIL